MQVTKGGGREAWPAPLALDPESERGQDLERLASETGVPLQLA